MKKDSGGIASLSSPSTTTSSPSSLASFRGMDKDKDTSSLPFPSSVLLTKPVGPSYEHMIPTHSMNPEAEPQKNASLPSINEFLDSYVKPHMAYPSPSPIHSRSHLPPPPSSSSGSPLPPSNTHSPSNSRRRESNGEHPDVYQHYQYQYQYHSHPQQQYNGGQQQMIQIREQQYLEMLDQRELMREQHNRREMSSPHYPHDYPPHSQFPYEQRRPELIPKREPDQAIADHKLSLREQLKLNLTRQQREGASESHDPQDSKSRQWSPRGSTPKSSHIPPSPLAKHHLSYSQHTFVVPNSPSSSPPPPPPSSFVPSVPKHQSSHYDTPKFTNYSPQEFQQHGKPSTSITPTSPPFHPSPLLSNSGKWNDDVYKQAKHLSTSLQSNVKNYLEVTSQSRLSDSYPPATVPSTPTSLSVPPSPSYPRHSVHTVPSSSPTNSPRTPRTPSSLTSSSPSLSISSMSNNNASNQPPLTPKRKASADMQSPPPKVQATMTPAQLAFQSEVQLFSSKDVTSGMQNLKSLMSNASLLDIYNKFHRHDEYAFCSISISSTTSTTSSVSISTVSSSSPSIPTSTSPMAIDQLTTPTEK